MSTAMLSRQEVVPIFSERSERERLEQEMLVSSSTLIALLGLVWGLMYLYFSQPLAAMIPLTYAGLSFTSIGFYVLTGRYGLFRFSQLLLTLLLPFFLMLALGGFINSSAVVLWSLLCPVGALLFASRRQAVVWFLAFLALVVAGGVLDVRMVTANPLSPSLITTFFVMNIVGVSVILFVLFTFFMRQRDSAFRLVLAEQVKSERLLLNVLPRPIADRLKEREQTIAECFEHASFLFADIVGYTPYSSTVDPSKVVDLLNEIYTVFDEVVERYGLEKIGTIGDGYLVASGVPIPRDDHAHALADAALEMMAFIDRWDSPDAKDIAFRMGMNTGPVMAGVIGRKKFSYNVWGDTVNVASRMESHGEPGRIQISQRVYDLLKDDFVCEYRGVIAIKGKGPMEAWYLVGRKPTAGASAIP